MVEQVPLNQSQTICGLRPTSIAKLPFSIKRQRALRHFRFRDWFLLLAILLPSAAWSQANYTPYTFTTLAGTPPGSADGKGSAARFRYPYDVAVDSAGNVYVADTYNHTIRKVTPAGVVTTLAGLALNPGSADGTGSAAQFYYPTGVAVDINGNVYVADNGNYTIRKVTPAGVVTTLAGLAGSQGGANGTGSGARFYDPYGVAVDINGNVYVTDRGNYAIRKVTPGGVVTTPAGLAGSAGSADGTGSNARFNYPSGVAVDTNGNVYVADQDNSTIRKVTPAGVVTTLAGLAGNAGSADGTNSAAQFSFPSGVAVDTNGNVYVADKDNYTIRKVTPVGTNWVVTTRAGLAGSAGSADGTGSAARFKFPRGVAVNRAGIVYVADTDNHTIRKMTSAGVVTTLAGLASSSGSADGTGSAARFYDPYGVATDRVGNVYVADTDNHTIRKVTPAGVVTTLAGLALNPGSADGTGSAAQFFYPDGVAVDSAGNVYVADLANDAIRKVTPAGVVTTLAGLAGSQGGADGTGSAAQFYDPSSVAVDPNGNLYVADRGNDTIRKVTPVGTNWVVTTLAGLAGTFGSADGIGSAALFSYPSGVAVDTNGNVYVADQDNHTIRKVMPGGVVTTLAGLAGIQGSADGTGSAAQFSYPTGVAVDTNGNLYVTDNGNSTIRKVTPVGTNWVVTTLAGLAGSGGSADGKGSAARFLLPSGVAVDSAGNVYVADTFDNTIRKGTPALQFDTSAGKLAVSNGTFHARLIGPPGTNVVLEASTNLATWKSVQTNAMLPFGLNVSVPLGTNQNRFFRARLAL